MPIPDVRLNIPLLAISPDGTQLVYVANRQLFLRSLSEMEAHAIPGTVGDPSNPVFSPDGRWIAFYTASDRSLKKIAVSGGAPLTIAGAESVFGTSWTGDHLVYAEAGKGVLRVPANGGQPEVIAASKGAESFFGPQLIDHGQYVLVTIAGTAGPERWDKAQTIVQRLGSTERTIVMRSGSAAQYVPTGHLVYALGPTLLAVRFDLDRREVIGGPVPVIDQVARASATTQSGVVHAVMSPTGALAYLPGDNGVAATGPKQLMLADIDGRTTALGFPQQWYIHPRFSPDGKQIAVATDDGREANIWIADLASGASLRRLTFGGRNLFPIWTPDGRYVTFQSDRDGDRAIYRQLADGSGVAERLTKPEEAAEHQPESWRPDGNILSLNKVFQGDQGVWTVGSGADAKPEVFVDTKGTVEKHSAFSPDGRWIAYMANTDVANTHSEVFVQPFPPTRAKYEISFNGGRTPLWSSDGRRLFYHEPSRTVCSSSTCRPARHLLSPGRPRSASAGPSIRWRSETTMSRGTANSCSWSSRRRVAKRISPRASRSTSSSTGSKSSRRAYP